MSVEGERRRPGRELAAGQAAGQAGGGAAGGPAERSKRSSEFICRTKFRTSLPERALDLRLVVVPPDVSSFAPYRPTRIEQRHQFSVPFDVMRTSLFDAVDIDKFTPPAGRAFGAAGGKGGAEAALEEVLAEGDRPLAVPLSALLASPEAAGAARGSAVRPGAQRDHQEVTWLRRTEYLATADANKVRAMNAAAPRDRHALGGPAEDTAGPVDGGAVVRAIEETFSGVPAIDRLCHPTRGAHVRAVAMHPIFPEHLGGLSSFTFDADPSEAAWDSIPLARHGDRRAIMLVEGGAPDDGPGEARYYLPAEGAKRRAGEEDTAAKYVHVRDVDIARSAGSGLQQQAHLLFWSEQDGASPAFLAPLSANMVAKRRRRAVSSLGGGGAARHSARHHASLNVSRD